MTCSSTKMAGPTMVWSKRSTSTSDWLFHPMTPWYSTAEARGARPSLEVDGSSGLTIIETAYQTANDVESPDTPARLGTKTTKSGDGISYEAEYADISSATDGKLWVRFGVRVRNSSGTQAEAAWAQIRVDLEPR